MLEQNIRVNVRHRPMFTMCLNEKASLALPNILLLLTDCVQQLYAAIATFLKCLLFAIAFCVLSADAIQWKIEIPTCQTRAASSIIEPCDVNCSLGVWDRIQVCNAKIWISGSIKDRIMIYRCKTLITYWETT